MIRLAIPIWLLTASLAWAQETTVWFTILGRGGAEEVEIGPEGGLVPYQLFVETDPLGTPGNLGLWGAGFTLDTDLLVRQLPPQLDPSFTSLIRFGGGVVIQGRGVDPDDIEFIGGGSLCPRPRGPCRVTLGIGQTGPQPVARGKFLVPPAPVGSQFEARILLEQTSTLAPSDAAIITSFGGRNIPLASADRLLANVLTIQVVANPPLRGDFDGDGDVDLADFLHVTQCLHDPRNAVSPDCEHADLDWDGDVDLADVVSLMGIYTGAN